MLDLEIKSRGVRIDCRKLYGGSDPAHNDTHTSPHTPVHSNNASAGGLAFGRGGVKSRHSK